MHKKKHKRKVNRIVIITSDAVDAKERQFKVHPWTGNLLMLICCILAGAVIGYAVYEGDIWATVEDTIAQKEADLAMLEEENSQLLLQIDTLTDKITVLSETVNQKAQDAQQFEAALAEQSMPTGFPLTGSASMEEVTEGEPICIFTAEKDITAVSAGNGTVTAVEDDEAYGHKITVDHGNGYVTIYRNKGDAKVKAGDSVVKGTTLYIIGEDNTQLGYQMMKDGAYINPMDMLSISG